MKATKRRYMPGKCCRLHNPPPPPSPPIPSRALHIHTSKTKPPILSYCFEASTTLLQNRGKKKEIVFTVYARHTNHPKKKKPPPRDSSVDKIIQIIQGTHGSCMIFFVKRRFVHHLPHVLHSTLPPEKKLYSCLGMQKMPLTYINLPNIFSKLPVTRYRPALVMALGAVYVPARYTVQPRFNSL